MRIRDAFCLQRILSCCSTQAVSIAVQEGRIRRDKKDDDVASISRYVKTASLVHVYHNPMVNFRDIFRGDQRTGHVQRASWLKAAKENIPFVPFTIPDHQSPVFGMFLLS